MSVKPITNTAGQPFQYIVNLESGVVHTRKTCSNLGRGADAGSMLVRDADPSDDFEACGKCVPAKCFAA